MALAAVEITSEVFFTCTTHAFTTETEEVMGLLLGDIQERPGVGLVARIWVAMPQIRTDRRKDRVETSPEQMARSSEIAARFTTITGVRTRVIGWYHSHPHITVLPSHVDVRTQALYQMLDEGFVGLIFSVFNHDSASKGQHLQVTAFQSVPRSSQLSTELSADLDGLESNLREALRVSAAAAADSSAMVHKEVPLTVMPASNSSEGVLTDYVALQRILLKEEQQAYGRALEAAGAEHSRGHSRSSSTSSTGGGRRSIDAGGGSSGSTPGSALMQLHHASAYQQALLQLMEVVLAPASLALQSRLRCNQVQLRQLQEQNKRLRDAARKQAAEPKPGRAPAAAGPVDLLTDDLITLNVADDVPSLPSSSSPLRATSISSAAAQQAQLPRPPHFLAGSGGSGVSGAAGAAAGSADAPGSPHLAQQLSWGRVFTSQQSIGSALAAQAAEGAAALAPSAAAIAAAERASAVVRSPATDRAGPLPRTSSSRGSGAAVPAANSSSSSATVAGHTGQQVQHQAGISGADRQLWGNAGSGSGGGGGSLRADVASTAAAPLPLLPTVVQTAAAARGAPPPVTDFSDLVHGLR